MNLLWPWNLSLLLIVPLIIAIYLWMLRRRRRFAVRYSSLTLFREAMPKRARWRRHLPFALFMAALTGLIVGMARPFTNDPNVARDLLEGRTERALDPPPLLMLGLSRLGGTSQAMMSVAQMGLLAKGKSPALRFGGIGAVLGALVEEIASLFQPKQS